MNSAVEPTGSAPFWIGVLKLQLLGQLVTMVISISVPPEVGLWMGYTSVQYPAMVLTVFLVVATGLIADRAIERGEREWLAYGSAVMMAMPMAFVAATLTQLIYLLFITLPAGTPDRFWYSTLMGSFMPGALGVFGILVYANRRTADRMLEKFRIAELRRARLERQLADSRLAAAEAQIDPVMLLRELGSVRAQYAVDSDRAQEQLNALIRKLRTAMSRTTSVEGQRIS